MVGINIGKYREVVKLLSETLTDDEAGGHEATLVEIAEVWANVTPITGSRALKYAEIVHGKPYQISIRYRDDIEVNESILMEWRGRKMNIKSVVIEKAEDHVYEIVAVEQAFHGKGDSESQGTG